MKTRKWATAAGFGLLCVAGLAGLYFQREVLVQFLQWISSIGLWGNLLFVLVFLIVGFPFALGYVPMAVGAGYLYGMINGTITVSIGALSGASLAFWLCRYRSRSLHHHCAPFRAFALLPPSASGAVRWSSGTDVSNL